MTFLPTLLAATAAVPGEGACFAAARDIAPGETIVADDLVAVDCRADAPRPPVRRDRASGMPVATGAIPAGAYLGRTADAGDRVVAAGAMLTLRSRAGPVTIERPVTALQPGRPGRKLFVRDAEGAVFAVRLEAEPRR